MDTQDKIVTTGSGIAFVIWMVIEFLSKVPT